MTMIELKPAKMSDKYRKKWNVNENDFVYLYIDGKKVSETFYRVGSFGFKTNNGYFMLLKHTEDFYDDSITKDKKRKPHLKSEWCILNEIGEEKKTFKEFESPYLYGIVYTVDNKFYNSETNELYCKSYSFMETQKYFFLNNEYDKDKSKRGVLKIDKSDGSYEVFQ